jgi:hypothetical protein
MSERILVTRNDIEDFFPIGKNVDNARLLQHVLRAQQSDLKPWIGSELYFQFVENFTDAIYQKLYNGGSYEYQGNNIYFGGIRQLLCSWAYARIYEANTDFVGRGGNTRKETEESTGQEQTITNIRSSEAESEALRLQAEMSRFLDQNSSDYPLWSRAQNAEAQQRTSMRITKVNHSELVTRGGM